LGISAYTNDWINGFGRMLSNKYLK